MWPYVLVSVIVPQLWALVLVGVYQRIDQRRRARESTSPKGDPDYII